MPLIEIQSEPTPDLGILETGSEASLAVGARLDGGLGTLETSVSGTFVGGVNVEFATIETGSTAALIQPAVLDAGLATIEVNANAVVLTVDYPEVWTLDLIIDIVPSLVPSTNIRWRPRFRADGVDIPITDFSYNESQSIAGGEVTVTLARPSDRSLFAVDTEIDFGFGLLTSPGVFDESSMDWKILGGAFTGYQYPIGWDNNAPTDRVIVSGSSAIYDKLNVTAETGIIFFDSNVETLTVDELEPIFDENGVSYLPELVGIAGLTLYDVLDRVLITECGFDAYEAPPDYPLRRVDCPMGQSLWASVSGFLGMYATEVVVESNTLKIIDTTLVSPSEFPLPKQVGVSQYQQLGLTDQPRNIDGLIVNISENKRNYDFVTQRFENETEDMGNSVSKSTEREYREYRRNGNPYVVIRDELARETIESFGTAGTVYSSDDRFTYNSRDVVSLRVKEVQNLLPDLDTGTPTLQTEREEREEFEYAAHPYKPRSQYLQAHTLTVRGAVTRDAANQQLGRDFIQPYQTSARSGNLQEGQTLETDFLVSVKRETFEPLRNGQVRVTEYEFDGTMNAGDGGVVRDVSETKNGDVSQSDISPHPTQIIVFAEDNHTRSKERLENVNYGELPTQLALPLARRTIKRAKEKSRSVNMTVPGYDPLLLKGYCVDARDRDGSTLGNYLILSLSISGDAVELSTNVTGIQV